MKKFAHRLVLLAAIASACISAAAQDRQRVLRFVPHTDIASLDPVVSGIYITRNFGYLVYDTLYGFDERYQPKPQMVDSHAVSADGLIHTFTLRAGLKWHDGTTVKASDCVTSLRRWVKRDGFGVMLATATDSMEASDERTFVIRLKTPFPLIEHALAKISGVPAFMMPERLAKADITTPLNEAIGSGPYKFERSEWKPGSRVVFTRNASYVPRTEPPSNAAGGKVAKFDRIEWHIIPDAVTAGQALVNNEVDWVETPSVDVLETLAASPGVTVKQIDPLGVQLQFRPNPLAAPFNNVKVRQALAYAVEQSQYLSAIAGDKKYWQVCQSFFSCKTPYETSAGAGAIGKAKDIAKAKQLLKEAGYKGEKVVILDAVDIQSMHTAAAILAEDLKAIGMNVEIQSMNFPTVLQRVTNRDQALQGKWSLFLTYTLVSDTLTPANHVLLRAGGFADGVVGWPTDEPTQELRAAFLTAKSEAERKQITEKLNARAFDQVLYLPVGQYVQPIAYRSNIGGITPASMPFFWSVEKK
ncbi:ABC transporter substrate-binding protein [Variovorax sp. LT1R20]|uniref:ABC transporter substrate-binding protein n=1 Tax=Variovorax sp. LT1R20 TaxID=3443729 RepID=UPI003F45AC79